MKVRTVLLAAAMLGAASLAVQASPDDRREGREHVDTGKNYHDDDDRSKRGIARNCQGEKGAERTCGDGDDAEDGDDRGRRSRRDDD